MKIIDATTKISIREDLPLLYNELGLVEAGVEVGVLRGHHAEAILKTWEGNNLILVDKWEGRMGNNRKSECVKRFKHNTRVQIKTSDSVAFSRTLEDETIDWVYIDAGHDYLNVSADLLSWYRKIKPGGIIAGHDYRNDGIYRDGPYGVKSAVDNFVHLLGVDLHLIDDDHQTSWYFQK